MTMRHQSFDFEIRDFIFLGARWAEQEAQTVYGCPFAALKHDARERICRILQNEYNQGEAWLSTLISYTLEALLGDPVYGGNIDEAGWRWLDHVPGEPRPVQRFVHGV
jgi:gluconate 2-dehydrogenase gamma chain